MEVVGIVLIMKNGFKKLLMKLEIYTLVRKQEIMHKEDQFL